MILYFIGLTQLMIIETLNDVIAINNNIKNVNYE